MNNIIKRIVMSYACLCIAMLNADNAIDSSLPTAFGRTHFIVGMSPDDISLLRQTSWQQLPDYQVSTYRKAYFSPDDGLEKKLIDLIDHEQASMKIAVFQFTNLEIAHAIKRAQQRGVAVEIITDPLCLQDKFNKVAWLSKEGLTIYIYNPDANKSTLSNKMHNKFVIFGNNVEGKKLVWIGSFNFTKSANIANQESVVVLDDTQIISQFNKQYVNLKERALKLEEFAKNHFIIQAWQPTDPDSKKRSCNRTSVAHAKKPRAHKRNPVQNFAIA